MTIEEENAAAAGGQQGGTGTETPPTNGEGVTPKEGTGPAPAEAKVFKQDEVNAIVAAEKRKYQERMSKLREAGLSEEQIQSLDKKEEVSGAQDQLEQIRKEKVDLVIKQNQSLVDKLDTAQVDKLRNAPADVVEEFFKGLSGFVKDVEKSSDQQTAGEGNLPSMEAGSSNIQNIPPEDMKLAEGIDHFAKTNDPSQMVASYFERFKL